MALLLRRLLLRGGEWPWRTSADNGDGTDGRFACVKAAAAGRAMLWALFLREFVGGAVGTP